MEERCRGELQEHVGDPRMKCQVPMADIPQSYQRKFTTYRMWVNDKMVFGSHWKHLTWIETRNWLRFRLSCGGLKVDDLNMIKTANFGSRVCHHCGTQVQDLQHVVLECPVTYSKFRGLGIITEAMGSGWWSEVYKKNLVGEALKILLLAASSV